MLHNLQTDEASLDKVIPENAEVVYRLTTLSFEGKSVVKQLKSARSHNFWICVICVICNFGSFTGGQKEPAIWHNKYNF